MCTCEGYDESLECIDHHRLADCSKRIFKLFSGDVYVGIYDSDYESIWESGSTSKFLSENNKKMSEIKRIIQRLEQTIGQSGKASFDLSCNNNETSLIFHKETGLIIIIMNKNKSGRNNDMNCNNILFNIILEISEIILS